MNLGTATSLIDRLINILLLLLDPFLRKPSLRSGEYLSKINALVFDVLYRLGSEVYSEETIVDHGTLAYIGMLLKDQVIPLLHLVMFGFCATICH